jgi:hypothetical protein
MCNINQGQYQQTIAQLACAIECCDLFVTVRRAKPGGRTFAPSRNPLLIRVRNGFRPSSACRPFGGSARRFVSLPDQAAEARALFDHAIHRLDQLLPWNWKIQPARLAA